MHGHQRKVQFRSHDPAWRGGGPKLRKPGDPGVRVDHVESHEQRKTHDDQHRKQGQKVVLDADDLVVQAEDILPDEALRRVMRVDYGRRHMVVTVNGIVKTGHWGVITCWRPAPASTFQNRLPPLPALCCASGNGRDRTTPSKGSRKCRVCRPGSKAESPCRARYPA